MGTQAWPTSEPGLLSAPTPLGCLPRPLGLAVTLSEAARPAGARRAEGHASKPPGAGSPGRNAHAREGLSSDHLGHRDTTVLTRGLAQGGAQLFAEEMK